MKTILVPTVGLKSDDVVLETAYRVARIFDSHIECYHVRPDPAQMIVAASSGAEPGIGLGMISMEILEALQETAKARAKAARKTFDALCEHKSIRQATKPAEGHGVSASWSEVEGEFARMVTAKARFDDLVVLGRSLLVHELSVDAVGAVVVGCGRPALLASAKATDQPISTIAIAWKETPEAARAVTAAMPLLAQAKKIVVLAASEDGERVPAAQSAEKLANQLRWHGFNVQAQQVPSAKKPVPEAVMAAACDTKADLLVMGAYSHSRIREFVFGGFTRHVLSDAPLPVLLAH